MTQTGAAIGLSELRPPRPHSSQQPGVQGHCPPARHGHSGWVAPPREYPDIGHCALYTLISTVGSFIVAIGVGLIVLNVARSVKHGAKAGPDPWKANTLEWFTQSPPPVDNVDVIPRVRSVEPMKDIRWQVARHTEAASVEVGAK